MKGIVKTIKMLTILDKLDLKAPDEGPKEGEGDDLL